MSGLQRRRGREERKQQGRGRGERHKYGRVSGEGLQGRNGRKRRMDEMTERRKGGQKKGRRGTWET